MEATGYHYMLMACIGFAIGCAIVSPAVVYGWLL